MAHLKCQVLKTVRLEAHLNLEVQGRFQSNLKTRKKRKEGRHLPNGLPHADVCDTKEPGE